MPVPLHRAEGHTFESRLSQGIDAGLAVDAVQKLFRCADQDGSGRIEFDEFERMVRSLASVIPLSRSALPPHRRPNASCSALTQTTALPCALHSAH